MINVNISFLILVKKIDDKDKLSPFFRLNLLNQYDEAYSKMGDFGEFR